MSPKKTGKSSKMPTENEITQEEPTAPARRDANGFELCEYGLPQSGPARAAALEAMGKKDPFMDPADWEKDDAALDIQGANVPAVGDASADEVGADEGGSADDSAETKTAEDADKAPAGAR